MSGLSDSKYTAKDCDIMLGITNPFSHELPEYLGYSIRDLKGNFRCLEVVLNRSGQSNGICPLFFDGAINYFRELPLPTNKEELSKVYSYVKNLGINDKTQKTFFSYGIRNLNIKLQKNDIFHKFAALFR